MVLEGGDDVVVQKVHLEPVLFGRLGPDERPVGAGQGRRRQQSYRGTVVHLVLVAVFPNTKDS